MSEYEETVEEPSSVQGMLNMYKALGLSLSRERIAQHALISAVLAVQVLVVGSLPAAMLTQVRDASRCCCYMGHSQPAPYPTCCWRISVLAFRCCVSLPAYMAPVTSLASHSLRSATSTVPSQQRFVALTLIVRF